MITGIVEGQNHLVVIDVNGIDKGFDQLLLTFRISEVQLGKPTQEISDMFLFEPQVFSQFHRGKCSLQFFLLVLQFIHALLGRFIKNSCLQCTNQIGDGLFNVRQGFSQGLCVGRFRVLRQIVLIGAFGYELQKLLIPQ